MKLWLLIVPALCAVAAEPSVRVSRDGGVQTIPLERYVAAVLAAESGEFRSEEALKAMAVAIRTFASRERGRHRGRGYDFCSTTHCQVLKPGDSALPKLVAIAAATAGEVLWSNGKMVFAPYSRDCGGRTEDAAALWPGAAAAHLRGRADEHCLRGGSALWRWTGDPARLAEALRRAGLRTPATVTAVSVIARTPSGRAGMLLLGGAGESVRVQAGSFRFAVGRVLGWNTVRSDRYEIRAGSGGVMFEGTGAGHGVGMCQRGAEQMGRAGAGYRDILAYYYPGTEAGVSARGFRWTELRAGEIRVLTTEPDRDRLLLRAVERAAARVPAEAGLALPGGVELRVYASVAAFRDATGEPGWVAARTRGRRVDVQPAAAFRPEGGIERAVFHELLHVAVEASAAPGLPLWFREGVVGYLAGAQALPTARGRGTTDAALRDRDHAASVRSAHREAAGAVARLAAQHGRDVVLGWVRRGLPSGIAAEPTR